jgi:benzoate-CoA ligase family protein
MNCVHHFLDRHVEEGRGSRVALRTADGELSYTGLLDLAARAGSAFLDAGVDYEQRVVLVLPDSPEHLACVWGAVRIGAIPVSLHTRLPADDYAYVCADCRPQVAVVSPDQADVFRHARETVGFPRVVLVADGELERAFDAADAVCPIRPTAADDTALIQYTSGSTGRPKGVVHLHGGVLALPPGLCPRLGLREDDVCLSAAKLFFGYGFGNSCLFPESVGATAALHAPAPDPIGMLEAIERYRPTVFFGGPSLWAALLAVGDAESAFDLSSVRLYVSAGEALSAVLFDRWQERFGQGLLNAFGSTECLHAFIATEEDDLRGGVSGTVVPPYEVKLVDEDGAEVEPGEIGYLHVKGPANGARYWNRHAATQQTMLGEWTRTGDLMTCDEDGVYTIIGRVDDVMKVRGLKVAPIEIEDALASHPAVAESAVVGSANDDGLTTICAYVRLNDGFEASPRLKRELRTYLGALLAPHKLPRSFEFVDALPRSGTGKLARYRLRESAGAR